MSRMSCVFSFWSLLPTYKVKLLLFMVCSSSYLGLWFQKRFCKHCWLLFECHLLALHQDTKTDTFWLFYILHPKRNSDIVVVFLIILFKFFMINDSVQQKMPCTCSVVLVVVLVELSGMGCGWEHASIALLELVASPLCLVLCPLGHDGGT